MNYIERTSRMILWQLYFQEEQEKNIPEDWSVLLLAIPLGIRQSINAIGSELFITHTQADALDKSTCFSLLHELNTVEVPI